MTNTEENLTIRDATIHSRRYEATGPRGEVILVHGFGEHSGRYEALIAHLLRHGYSVTAYDHRGHGKSSGLYGHVDRFSQYEEDLQEIVLRTRSRKETQNLFLIGHSMGGLVTLRYLTKHRDGINGIRGAVISAPLVAVAAKVPAHKLLIARVGAKLAPRLRLPNEINPAVLSRDQEIGRAYAADPLVGKMVSTRWFAEAVQAMEELKRDAGQIRTPLLVMHGSEDRLANVEATKAVFPSIASPDKELKIYQGYYHELFNEPEKQEIYDRVTEWLEAH